MGGQDCWQQSHQVSGCRSQSFSSGPQERVVHSKGKTFPQSPMWVVVGVGRGAGVSSLLTLEDQTAEQQGGRQGSPRPRLMERGMRVLGPPAATVATSQVPSLVWQNQPPCLATPGVWLPWKWWKAEGWGDEPPSPLGSKACATPTLQELGWPSSSRLPPCGTGRLAGTDPSADLSPFHFLWTWTLAYSE